MAVWGLPQLTTTAATGIVLVKLGKLVALREVICVITGSKPR
jgi:hypothetical protein